MDVRVQLEQKLGKGIGASSNEVLFCGLLEMTKQIADDKKQKETKKKIYYVSAEFLIGKLLSNNLINLGIYDEVKCVLAEEGKNLAELDVRKKYGITVVGVMQGEKMDISFNPQTPLPGNAILVLIGANKILEKIKIEEE